MALVTRLVDLVFSLDTSAYTAGDVLADTQVLSGALLEKNKAMNLVSLTLIDEDDQGAAFDVYFFDANVSLGTENGAPNISDASGRSCLGVVPVATGDWKDLGGVRIATFKSIGLVLKPATDTNDIYVGLVNGAGTPTYTAAGLRGRFGFGV